MRVFVDQHLMLVRMHVWLLAIPREIVLMLVVLVVFGAMTPAAVRAFSGGATPVRVAVAAGLLFPMGLVMGLPFAIGMRVASSRDAALTPWLWGVNGAASVCCSVLAVAVALTWGIAAAFWAGALCYALALAAYVAATRG